jgi:hypothetical protein
MYPRGPSSLPHDTLTGEPYTTLSDATQPSAETPETARELAATSAVAGHDDYEVRLECSGETALFVSPPRSPPTAGEPASSPPASRRHSLLTQDLEAGHTSNSGRGVAETDRPPDRDDSLIRIVTTCARLGLGFEHATTSHLLRLRIRVPAWPRDSP